jgi:tetratricopeptide (TPR) repeat protein
MEKNSIEIDEEQTFQESFALLRLWYKKRKYDDALNLLNDMLRVDSKNHMLLDRKGIILVKQGKYQPALACFEAAIKMNPQHLDAWNNKAVALAESGNSRESLLVLDQALAMAIPNPSVEVKHRMAKIYMNKGNILFTQGRVEEAITCYNNAIELHKDYASAWTSKGFALDNMGQYEEAIKCFHNALMINKDLAKMHTNKGLEAFRQKKYTEAVYHYDKALDVDPGVSEVLLHKGDALLAKTRDKEAVTAYYFAFSSEVNKVLGTNNPNNRKSGVERGNKTGARAEDRFQVVSRLGKGVAKVNLVKEKDDPTGTIKVLKKIEYSYLPVNVNNARREALYATRFEHRNLVKTYDCWYEFSESTSGSTSPTKRRTNAKGSGSPANVALQKFSVYILMEYCEKGDLGTPKKRDEDDIRLILEQALEALHYLHGVHKVVHRDIKLDNFFLTKNYVLKLGDYGSSVKIAQAQGLCGTPGYQAPETLDLRMKYDEKVDIFSLGICLSELATGLPIKDLVSEHFSVMLLENNVSNMRIIEAPQMVVSRQ